MGRSKFEINLPVFFEKKTIANFNLDKKFFEFSEYFLVDDYSINVNIVVVKKNSFWQLDADLYGTINTKCDRCSDFLKLNVEGKDRYFVKIKDENFVETNNVIFISHASDVLILDDILKELLFFILPKRRVHDEGGCNIDTIEKLNSLNKSNSNNRTLFSESLKEKFK